MRRMVVALGIGIAVIALGAVVLRALPPSIDPAAASTPIARTAVSGTGGGECLPRITRGSGWADLCWQVWRLGPAEDADGTKDYYVLRVAGSHQGLRWAVVRSRLLTDPGDNVFDVWPQGTFEGACRQESVSLLVPLGALEQADICGHTEGQPDFQTWSERVAWRCEGCLFPGSLTREIALYNLVAVPEGSVPSWDLFADAGS